MSTKKFQLVDDQTFSPSDVVDGKIFVSPDQINGEGTDLSTGLRVIIDYHDLQSEPAGATLQALVEGKSAQGQFYVLAYQFEEFGLVGFPQKRQIVMAPDLDWPDAGIDNIIFVGGSTVERISNQQAILPDTWRISINIKDLTPPRFVSARLSIYGERSNQLTFPEDFRGILTDTDGTIMTEVT